MKLVISAAVAALALAAMPAWGQTTAPAQTAVPASRCAAIPSAPTLPDGARARNQAAMMAGNAAYEAWGASMMPVMQCRQAEAREARAAAEAARAVAEARVQEFNRGVALQCEVVRAWRAEVTEYNRRQGEEPPPLPENDPCGPAPAAAN